MTIILSQPSTQWVIMHLLFCRLFQHEGKAGAVFPVRPTTQNLDRLKRIGLYKSFVCYYAERQLYEGFGSLISLINVLPVLFFQQWFFHDECYLVYCVCTVNSLGIPTDWRLQHCITAKVFFLSLYVSVKQEKYLFQKFKSHNTYPIVMCFLISLICCLVENV